MGLCIRLSSLQRIFFYLHLYHLDVDLLQVQRLQFFVQLLKIWLYQYFWIIQNLLTSHYVATDIFLCTYLILKVKLKLGFDILVQTYCALEVLINYAAKHLYFVVKVFNAFSFIGLNSTLVYDASIIELLERSLLANFRVLKNYRHNCSCLGWLII